MPFISQGFIRTLVKLIQDGSRVSKYKGLSVSAMFAPSIADRIHAHRQARARETLRRSYAPSSASATTCMRLPYALYAR